MDTIDDMSPTHATGVWTPTGDEFFYKGHFPDYPLTPGVLILEAFAQMALAVSGWESNNLAVITSVGRTRFRNFVLPGEPVQLTVDLEQRTPNELVVSGNASVARGRVCSSTLTLSVPSAPTIGGSGMREHSPTLINVPEVIPNRYPFLFIDGINSITPGQNAEGHWYAEESHPIFAAQPVIPNAVLIEAICQVTALSLLVSDLGITTLSFGGVNSATLDQPVAAGTEIVIQTQIRSLNDLMGRVTGEVFVEGSRVFNADLVGLTALPDGA